MDFQNFIIDYKAASIIIGLCIAGIILLTYKKTSSDSNKKNNHKNHKL